MCPAKIETGNFMMSKFGKNSNRNGKILIMKFFGELTVFDLAKRRSAI